MIVDVEYFYFCFHAYGKVSFLNKIDSYFDKRKTGKIVSKG